MTEVVERQVGRAIFAIGVIFALLLSALFINSANANASFDFVRYQGADRYLTGKDTAVNTFPDGTSKAIVASGRTYPDALAASFLAGNLGGPVLLTTPDVLSTATKDALTTLKVKEVTIVGGTGAVSTAVENELKDRDSTDPSGGKLTVTRIAGENRYESASKIATAAGTTVGTIASEKTAIIARGDQFPDALAGGPLGYAGKLPVLLTEGAPATVVNGFTKAALNSLGIEQVLILGGTGAITSDTETDIQDARGAGSITTVRLQGSTRSETARAIAEYALTNMSFVDTHVDMARGDGFADALSGAAHAGVAKAPILLTVSQNILSLNSSTGARKYLSDHASTLATGHIYGGTGAVSAAVETEAEKTAGSTGASPSPSGSSGSPSPSPSPTVSPSPNANSPKVTFAIATDGSLPALPNVLDANDHLEFVFSKAMSPSVAAVGSRFTLKDADLTQRDLVCGETVICVLQPAGTYEGVARVANQVMRAKVLTTPSGGTPGTVPTLAYPSDLVDASAHWADGTGNYINIPSSDDRTVNQGAMSPARETTGPTLDAAAGVGGASQSMTLTFSRPVACSGLQPGQVDVTVAAATTPARSLSCPKTTVVNATFPTGTLITGTSATASYEQSAETPSDRITDLDGNFAAQPAEQAFTPS